MWKDFLDTFGGTLMEGVLPTIATGLAALLSGVVFKLFQKLKLDLSEAQRARIKELAEDAIRAAEEAARRRLAAGGEKMDGEEKRGLAIDTMATAAPEATAKEIGAALDSQLPVVRAAVAVADAIATAPVVPVQLPGIAGPVKAW